MIEGAQQKEVKGNKSIRRSGNHERVEVTLSSFI